NFAPTGRTVNIQESTSTNGVAWTSSDTDALPTLGSWAAVGNTWAPAVAFNGSEFVMYYVAIDRASGDQCIGQAESSTPEGPYVDASSTPFICQDDIVDGQNDNYGGSIDPDI